MSTRKRHRAKQNIFRQIWKLTSAIPKWLISWFLRTLLVIGRKPRFAKSGFVLPTTALLLIILALVVGSLIFRSFSRTNQVLAAREQKVIYNAATPAIDRAKAKLEYLFKQDDRLPGGVPSSAVLSSMMLNDGLNGVAANSTKHPYTFPDEKRLDIDNDDKLDNVWAFPVDSSGNKIGDTTTVYSILSATESGTGTSAVTIDKSTDAQKAAKLVVRNAPLSSFQNSLSGCKTDSRTPENGWYQLNSATLRKNFQVDAFVINNNTSAKTVTTLELQQDRQVDKGNKWAVWFRNDLEIFPLPTFNLNGAMHTEGNFIIGGDANKVTGYMISSHNSCLYSQEASKVTVAKQENYEGQIVSGTMKSNSFSGESKFHLFDGLGNVPTQSGNTQLKPNTDSVTPDTGGVVADIALDPIALFTKNESKHRSTATWSRDSAWQDRDFVKKRRILNDTSAQPYLDDTYRADNRYGPKPKYNPLLEIPSGKKVGDEIASVTELTKDDPPSGSDSFGLDGYWERRARANGLRVIVGERLELGNTYGWEGSNDPLYPPPSTTTITHEARQRRTLRDNLAAVQATAIYHHEKGNSGYFPIAFLATTVHPGTSKSLQQSTTFSNESTTNTLNIDFLGGTPVDINGDNIPDTTLSQGTNGWEFEVVPGAGESESTFANLINNSTSPLRKALKNLAYLAGDPDGAFPPLQEAAGSKIVHPFPELTMWGNFSNLRRVISKLDAGTSVYNDPSKDLSIADKSTLHTAAATLGMLAYNIQNYRDIYTGIVNGKGASGLGALGTQLFQLVDGTASSGNGEIGKGANGLCDYNDSTPTTTDNCPAFVNSNATPYDPTYYEQFTGEDYFTAFKNNPGLGANATGRELVRRATLLMTMFQIERDRTFGFTSKSITGQLGNLLPEVKVPGEGDFQFRVGCSDAEIDQLTTDLGVNPEKQLTGLALALCSLGEQPKYPSLYYLFPKVNHDHDGNDDTPTGDNHTQPYNPLSVAEPYIADLQDLDGDGIKNEPNSYITKTTVNGSYNYQVLNPVAPDDFSGILLRPKNKDLTAGCTDANWCLPTATSGTVFTNATNRITKPDGNQAAIPFLDKGIFDGREMMNVRVLDFDLDLLRKNKVTNDTWLPLNGIVYAFREDAVREDGIARPASTTWSTYQVDPTNSDYRMKANTPQDPPVNADNGISPKPVDYYPDPDRRSHGFRLRNGAVLKRDATGISAADNIYGLSFITDNSVYVQGNFNLHSTDGTTSNLIEEFNQKLQYDTKTNPSDWNNDPNFYTGRTSINSDFADPTKDTWRPTEIVADAVMPLSSNFNDGTVEDGFTKVTPGSPSTSNTSYQNQNRPKSPTNSNIKYWVREELYQTSNSPIKVNQSGYPLYCKVTTVPCPTSNQQEYGKESGTPLAYRGFSESRDDDLTPAASPTRINAIFIQGILPSQANQSYGGLHNFPRFLESWSGKNLYISGAFLQLNFSTANTGPYDPDAWEPSATASTSEYNYSYKPPNRLWGYDVGLQYAPAGAAARRFVTLNNTRSEFYRELPVDDPYIKNLRCTKLGTQQIDSSASCS
ncbi:hypothetical protein H6G17_25180 [Chroococcidiopsis sp. FACHB-1243]|uniref:hormogonium polysaccharide biosynthesis protein HpsA n=1 Tax=Chroococcidiopsis sp. [FACHB-1243] TaxID=2692781 RepID=UPI0017836084|nr:hormogonium polysaccharide biosynthesis protein HpsA [Chroococcidiopsis sp. [FACHB-1243]]MBD2308767.1 hypothetical protein [Chroococcidiopsis sp. [FACHB-1243]]